MESTIKCGDCLELMKEIADESVNLILCDLPYGTITSTTCAWDVIIPFEPLWEQYKRILKEDGNIVLFAVQPFTSKLIMSNLEMFRYMWYWNKISGANFLNVRHQPFKILEDIAVFTKRSVCSMASADGIWAKYHPQDIVIKDYVVDKSRMRSPSSTVRIHLPIVRTEGEDDGQRYPVNMLTYQRDSDKYHPTQKPVELLRYLIRTYTDKGDLVLDNCMGSGSTGVACVYEDVNFIGYEKEQKFFDVASKRIEDAKNDKLSTFDFF